MLRSTRSVRIRKGGVLGVVALLLSLVAIGGLSYHWFLRSDPLGKGMSAYDFSSPNAAVKSMLEIQQNMDLNAMMELQRKTPDKELQERLDTLKVEKEATWDGKSILFVSYKVDGKEEYRIESFEKHADSGLWKGTYVSEFEVEKDDKKLAATMRSWQRDGSLEPKPEDMGPGGVNFP